jgi:hypothetical protein
MKATKLGLALRRHPVPLALGGALLVAVVVFWRPLVSWFGGDAADHQASAPSAPEPDMTPSQPLPDQPVLPASTLPDPALSPPPIPACRAAGSCSPAR